MGGAIAGPVRNGGVGDIVMAWSAIAGYAIVKVHVVFLGLLACVYRSLEDEKEQPTLSFPGYTWRVMGFAACFGKEGSGM